MHIDFRGKPPVPVSTSIKGEVVEVVKTYKSLSTIGSNTELLCKKGQQYLSGLRKLSKFNVDKTLMTTFYKPYTESVLTFSMLCWCCNLSLWAKISLFNVVKQ